MNPPTPIRILLVDDHEMVRTGLRALLEHFSDLLIVGEAGTGSLAVDLAASLEPDVVLLDLRLPDIPGAEVCRRIIATGCEARVLILTSFLDHATALEGIEAGASGFLLKHIDRAELRRAITDVAAGGRVFPPEVAQSLALALQERNDHRRIEARMAQLSAQERRIASLVAGGKLNKEIAEEMGLSEKTVKNYLGRIFIKLGAARRSQVAVLYMECQPGRSTEAPGADRD
ncbi:MAG: response regulator transcription factor [Candidatus Methylacidiphilales bacterium]|nr:response regulator transcription factor [Candidatus Methylacidiphilales bacterium]